MAGQYSDCQYDSIPSHQAPLHSKLYNTVVFLISNPYHSTVQQHFFQLLQHITTLHFVEVDGSQTESRQDKIGQEERHSDHGNFEPKSRN